MSVLDEMAEEKPTLETPTVEEGLPPLETKSHKKSHSSKRKAHTKTEAPPDAAPEDVDPPARDEPEPSPNENTQENTHAEPCQSEDPNPVQSNEDPNPVQPNEDLSTSSEDNAQTPKKHKKKQKSSSSSDSSRSNKDESDNNAQTVGQDNEEVLITAVDDPAQRPETPGNSSDLSPSEPEPDVPSPPASKYSDEDLQAALDRMLKKKRMPEMEMRPSLVDYAKNQSVYQLMQENYDQAAKIDEAIDLLMQSLHRDEDAQDCEKQTESLKEKYQFAQQQNKSIQEEFSQRIEQFKEAENERLQKLEEQHEQERAEFEEQWARPETTASFTKPSAGLLQVRKMQKSMAIAHKFEEAKRLKAAGDQMQREESVVASQKAVATMKVAYQQLIDKQEREVECFMANGYRKLQTLESERDRKLQANEKLRTQLDTRIKGPKVPRRPPVPLPDLQPVETRGSVTGIISTRTRSQLAVYKKSPETTRLEVRLGDIQKITKPMTPSPKKGQRRRFG